MTILYLFNTWQPYCSCFMVLLQEYCRQRSVSLSLAASSTKDSLATFLSTPDITSEPYLRTKVSTNGYSIQDLAVSGIVYQQQLHDSSDLEEDTTDSEKSLKPKWNLVYNPRCIMLGVSIFAFFAGFTLTYQCIPALGKESGKSDSHDIVFYNLLLAHLYVKDGKSLADTILFS